MQNTMVTESKPLIAIDDFHTEKKTTQNTPAKEKTQLVTLDDLVAHKQKILSKKILILVIIVNMAVLLSIILFT